MREEVSRTFAAVCLKYNSSGCRHGGDCWNLHFCRNFVKYGICTKGKICLLYHFVTRKAITMMRRMKVVIDYQAAGETDPDACLNLFSDLICSDMAPKNMLKACACAPAISFRLQGGAAGVTEESTQGMRFREENLPNNLEGQLGEERMLAQKAQSRQRRSPTTWQDIAAYLIRHDGWAKL